VTRFVLVAALLSLAVPARAIAQGESGQFVVRGMVRDAQTESAISRVTIEALWEGSNAAPRLTATSDDSGRFVLRTDRGGTLVVSLRRLGYQPQRRTVVIASDTTTLLVRLVRTSQMLPTVTVTESAVDFFVDSVRTEFLAFDHARFFDTKALEHSKQTFAGAFLFGQAGMQSAPCRRSAQFLPPGTARTSPVENEPADYWFPCVLARGTPRSVLVSIDGGPPEPFGAISQRELTEFAMVAVFGGRVVVAYTKAFATARATASR
jgi:Carboxypeptidase regulatory-like domain